MFDLTANSLPKDMRNLLASLCLNSQQLLGEGECEPALGHELLHGDVAAQPGVEAEGPQHAVGEDGRQRLRGDIHM